MTDKKIEFLGSSLKDLKRFPDSAMQDAGYQLHKVQTGKEPDDWKPVRSVGSGVKEVRIWDKSNTFRIIYVAKFAGIIYVLHAFQKKTEKTRKADIQIAKDRYREISRRE